MSAQPWEDRIRGQMETQPHAQSSQPVNLPAPVAGEDEAQLGLQTPPDAHQRNSIGMQPPPLFVSENVRM
jgi:hypothetical protein